MSGALIGSIRVTEASLDDERGVLVVMGELEFGTIRKGMEARLPLPAGGFVLLPVDLVAVAEDAAGFPRQVVHFTVPAAEMRLALREMTLAGRELEILRPQATSPAPSAFNGTCAAFGLLILAASFFVPVAFGGQQVSGQDIAWQAVSVVLFIGSFVLIRKSINWSLLVLMLACAFFFVSCAANFEMRMT